MAERDRIRALLTDALSLLSPDTSSPKNNTSWADRPSISSQQHERSSTINANTAALPDPVVSNFQRCFPAARGQSNPLARRGGRAMPHYIKPSTETHDFFLLREKSASLSLDRGLVDFKRMV